MVIFQYTKYFPTKLETLYTCCNFYRLILSGIQVCKNMLTGFVENLELFDRDYDLVFLSLFL